MRIGLAFDLRVSYLAAGYSEQETAEFDAPDTIDAIAEGLAGLGHEVERIGNAQELAARLIDGERWDLVFNICEGLHGFGREALVPALLEAYAIPYTFSDPLVCALTLHKGMAKRVVRDHGFPTPAFAVVENEADLADVSLPMPLFVKPVAEGTSKGISAASVIRQRRRLRPACRALLRSYREPVLVEAFLPGREFTVGVVGTGAAARVLGTLEVLLGPEADPEVYSYRNKEHFEGLVDYRLLTEVPLRQAVEELGLGCWRALGCRDGGRVDVRCDAEGRPQFLEVNPLAGLNPHHSDLPMICRFAGLGYRELLAMIVESARLRAPTAATAAAACSTA
jgi:D-alanine-D-alanine ligase